ncbi:GNAT family N-acetyltransferase [Rubeoparvulum massiliense]|uniref:GNAT family N-acetyltransferase n=1 Tax=Rubeoparvulum massiliense TaxID=1631346 RepID=UPI00065E48A5|nr:GNAT family N-acetyltransferase [Rubeoparvulum massiliense]
MNILQLSEEQFSKHRGALLHFIQRYGDQRITFRAIRWIKRLPASKLSEAGTFVLVARSGNELKAVLVIGDYGKEEALVVVHPDSRNDGIGKALLDHLFRRIDRAYGRVAIDNLPSMKMCFGMGMVAIQLTTGPTGKPTLWFGMGKWSLDDLPKSSFKPN